MADLDTFNPAFPMRNVVLCCTSISPEKRTVLMARAIEMGATHDFDLTSNVTHLIAADYNTPKYRYVAKQRPDVKVLVPGWVDAVRELWMADKKIDMAAIERQYALPTFATLRISITGFEDYTERQLIIDLVKSHGAEYDGNLSRETTHLLAFQPEGSKYEHAKKWGRHIVTIQWLHDSIERGMILDEKLYHPDLPAEERGKDAWIRRKLPVTRKRARAEEIADEGRCKLRRTASMKLNSESQKMWGDIMISGAPVVNDQVQAGGEWEDSKVKESSEQSDAKPVEQQIERPKSLFNKPTKPREMFDGRRFYLYGFKDQKLKILEDFLVSYDARLVHTLDAMEQFDATDIEKAYIMIPHNLPVLERPEIPETLSSIPIINEFWVERCYDLKMVVDPAQYIMGRPFPQFPIPRFSGMTISSTGFDKHELLHVSKTVELFGAKYDEYFTHKHSVLICGSSEVLTRAKFVKAQEWKVPVVSSNWLWDCIQAGERQPFQKYVYRIKKAKTGSDRSASRSSSPKSKTNPASGRTSDVADVIDLEADSDETLNESTSLTLDNSEVPLEESEVPLEESEVPFEEPEVTLEESASKPPVEDSTYNAVPPTAAPNPSPTEITRLPLGESSGNTATMAAVRPSELPTEEIDNAITTVLATKTKSSSNPAASDPAEVKKPRGRTRLLGRVASNLSTTSAASYESSVDSTATHGHAVHWPSEKSFTKDTNKKVITAGGESQNTLPQTQVEWEEEESNEHKNRIVATMKGETVGRKSLNSVKQRAVTLGDLNETPRESRSGKGGRSVRKR